MSLSFAARVTNLFLRWKVKPNRRAAFDVAKARAKLESLAPKNLPLLPGVTRTPVAADAAQGTPAGEWLRPAAFERTVLYLHGGGYFSCSVDTHRPVCAQIARRAKAQVYSVEYRLAPEHPFPAGIEDAVRAYAQVLASGVASDKLVIAGDSAGGGLALACLLEARTRGLPMPAGAVLFSPWTDLTLSGESMRTMAARDAMFRPEQFPATVDAYLGAQSPENPLASPLFADLAGLPPLMIWASEHEILNSDATRLHAAALAHGVQSELHLAAGLPHVWPIMVSLPESKAALAQVAEFIKRCAGEGS
jgi:epsilon-lactone hydrolase